jgi:hypothetical protein
MRKTVVGPLAATESAGPEPRWLDVTTLALVEVTSEDPDFPVESVFSNAPGIGWRAGAPGEQSIRLRFDAPVSLRRIQLQFIETEHERTQEFTLRWAPAGDAPPREIVRQQWNFSPSGSTREEEDYHLNLDGVSLLELRIQPDQTHRAALATLALFRLA